MLISRLQNETSLVRQKLLVLYLLSYISEFAHNTMQVAIPSYIMQALVFIEEHYQEKITAASLAKRLYIGRTTLMMNFKKYTDSTLNNYIIQCRLKKAIILLCQGKTESEIAEIVSGTYVAFFNNFFKLKDAFAFVPENITSLKCKIPKILSKLS